MHWTKERPTKPGFYFVRYQIEPLPFDGATKPPIAFCKVTVVEAMKYAEMQFWEGPIRHVDSTPDTEFAGPIPLPEESRTSPGESRSCYDCVHCLPVEKDNCFGGKVGQHHCSAPCPMWVHGCANDEVPIIEDSGHDATMAKNCSLFMKKEKD